MTDDGLIPTEPEIYAWIERVFAEGVRRPGYAADRWCETWAQEQFRAFGLERVRAEPVSMQSWEPREASLVVTTADGETIDVPCFQLPNSARGEFDAPVVSFDADEPASMRGAIVLRDVPLMRVPYSWYQSIATYTYDPDGSFEGASHTLPFARELMDVMEPSIEAGAVGFIGVLKDYPGDSFEYFVPYDAKARAIPGVWIRGSDGARLHRAFAAGGATARLRVDAASETITSYNIIGELPGRDDETVVIGSHHDGPWSSAVEDASGIALVLAQAAYWSRMHDSLRPHRLVFLLNSGHMAGGAGQAAFVAEHRVELERCVLALHLEHVANEMADDDGVLRSTGRPESRWWFTSRINRLEASLREAIEDEHLDRSLILRPDTFGEKPTTDGADFYPAGVPIVQHLAAPFYLFDAMDTLDKIHRPSLLPLTRAAIRIIESTAGVSAAEMRADVVRVT